MTVYILYGVQLTAGERNKFRYGAAVAAEKDTGTPHIDSLTYKLTRQHLIARKEWIATYPDNWVDHDEDIAAIDEFLLSHEDESLLATPLTDQIIDCLGITRDIDVSYMGCDLHDLLSAWGDHGAQFEYYAYAKSICETGTTAEIPLLSGIEKDKIDNYMKLHFNKQPTYIVSYCPETY